MAGCGCGGGGIKVRTNGHETSVTETATTPGMPKYRVTADDGTVEEFSTYIAARDHKHANGGKLRAI